ncbi:MAG: transposase [Acidothermales bacterium]|nr:transposase [Acidothermales bacterium]
MTCRGGRCLHSKIEFHPPGTGRTPRQYTGTAGRIENTQVAVYVTYAAPRGNALIDRALYLPTSWTEDTDRCARAGVPAEVKFATKPARAGDEVYGADPRLRAPSRGHRLGYVLKISANRRVPTDAGPIRFDQLPACSRRRRGNTAAPAATRRDTTHPKGPSPLDKT